mmetsp:Transcript_66716/g.77426  ORF Transcript_66716/g.77426 Transcript_66716/m.77426 type:complete len:124 (-) Transcript_66716:186-557(-)
MIGLVTSLLVQVVALLVQIGYPVLGTYDYLKKGEYNRQWLTYWSLYFVAYTIESFLAMITGCGGCMTYTILKTLICLWLVHPTYLGASWIHAVVIEKVFHTVNAAVEPHIGHRLGHHEVEKKE